MLILASVLSVQFREIMQRSLYHNSTLKLNFKAILIRYNKCDNILITHWPEFKLIFIVQFGPMVAPVNKEPNPAGILLPLPDRLDSSISLVGTNTSFPGIGLLGTGLP